MLRIIAFAKDVTVDCSSSFQRLYEEPNSTVTILVPFEFIRPGVNIPMALTFNYPKGQAPFVVMFNVDADEIPTGTFLGGLNINPSN